MALRRETLKTALKRYSVFDGEKTFRTDSLYQYYKRHFQNYNH